MKKGLSISEYDRLDGQVRSAWVQLNQAGDIPDPHRSLLCLQSALDSLLAVEAALHDTATPEETVALRHHSLRSRRIDAAGILKQLSERTRELHYNPDSLARQVPDALLAHQAIPVIWRLIRSIRHEVRSLRPFSTTTRMIRRSIRVIWMGLAAWGLLQLAWLAAPWGCFITYYRSQNLQRPQGWSAAATLSRDYGKSRPLPWMHSDAWSARWSGVLLAPESADYRFYAQCAGGLRLWVDGERLVDQWTSPGWTRGVHAQRHLTKGRHRLKMEFRDRGGRAAVRVRWSGGPIPPNTEIEIPHLRKY